VCWHKNEDKLKFENGTFVCCVGVSKNGFSRPGDVKYTPRAIELKAFDGDVSFCSNKDCSKAVQRNRSNALCGISSRRRSRYIPKDVGPVCVCVCVCMQVSLSAEWTNRVQRIVGYLDWNHSCGLFKEGCYVFVDIQITDRRNVDICIVGIRM
jgi:hypothetical protein